MFLSNLPRGFRVPGGINHYARANSRPEREAVHRIELHGWSCQSRGIAVLSPVKFYQGVNAHGWG